MGGRYQNRRSYWLGMGITIDIWREGDIYGADIDGVPQNQHYQNMRRKTAQSEEIAPPKKARLGLFSEGSLCTQEYRK